MKRALVVLSGIVILSMLTMGCSLCSLVQRKGQEVAQTAVATVQAGLAEQATVIVGGATPPSVGATPGGGTAQTPSAMQGTTVYQPLAGLDSYRYEMDSEVVDKGIKTVLWVGGAYVREPSAARLDLQSVKGDDPMLVIKTVQVGDRVYTYDQERGGWMVTNYVPGMAAMTDILGLITNEIEQDLDQGDVELIAAHEDVEGIDCSHYRGDPKGISTDLGDEAGFTVTSGQVDMWVANGLGYLMLLEMEAKGVDSGGQPAEQHLELRMFDVNGEIEILPPPEQEIIQDLTGGSGIATPTAGGTATGGGILQTLPRPEAAESLTGSLPPEAQGMAGAGGELDVYQTKLSTSELTAFYKEQMANQGWTEGDSVPMGEMALLVFSKDGATVNVMILGGQAGAGSMVVLSVE